MEDSQVIRTDIEAYQNDIYSVAGLPLPWEMLRGKTLLLSGATGMIGCFLIDVLMEKNQRESLGISVLALTRDPERAALRATEAWADHVRFLACDINQDLPSFEGTADIVIHAASNTHPVAYATDPIGTVLTNILGTRNMLEAAAAHGASRFVFLSSVEVYGENRGDCEAFGESYCGYIDCNTLRAGYPEGKRAGEALCQAYLRQKGIDVVVPRLPRTYGPTMLWSDTKAISQFIKNGVSGTDIVLKSAGAQLFSYGYVADSVSGILYCLFFGKTGEAYNIGDSASDITLRDLAQLIADHAGTKLVFEIPDATESAGYSKATKALLDGTKLKSIGWRPLNTIASAIPKTIDILRLLRYESSKNG